MKLVPHIPLWKLAAIVLTVCIAGVTAIPVVDYFSGRKLIISTATTAITEPLHRTGVPMYQVVLNEKYGWNSVSPNENVAVALLETINDEAINEMSLGKIAATLGASRDGPKLQPPSDSQFDAEQKHKFIPQSVAECKPWTTEQNPLIAQWLTESEDALAVIRMAVRERKFLRQNLYIGSPPSWDWELMLSDALQTFRGMFRCRCMLRLAEHRFEEALDDYETLTRISSLMSTYRSPLYWIYACGDRAGLSTIEYELLKAPELNLIQWEKINRLSESIEPLVPVKEIINESLRYQILLVKTHSGVKGYDEYNINTCLRSVNMLFDQSVEAACQTNYCDRALKLLKMTPDDTTSPLWSHFNKYLRPRHAAAVADYERASPFILARVNSLLSFEASAHTLQRSSALARLVAKYQLVNNRLPDKLDDLTTSVPVDLFSGSPLKYKTEANERDFTVYALWINNVDQDPGLEGKTATFPYGYDLQQELMK